MYSYPTFKNQKTWHSLEYWFAILDILLVVVNFFESDPRSWAQLIGATIVPP